MEMELEFGFAESGVASAGANDVPCGLCASCGSVWQASTRALVSVAAGVC